MPVTVREALRDLGVKRREQHDSGIELADQIKLYVEKARLEAMPMTEVAQLLGIDRSTLYRVYLNDGS